MKEKIPPLKKVAKTAMLIFLIISAQVAWSQQAITGTVIAEDGLALPGVNIMVEGTSTGTTSDADGKFSISVPSNDAVLLFSFIGYKTSRVPVGSQSVLRVMLDPDARALEEVVVMGYGEIAKKDVLGAVGHVNSEVIAQRQAINPFEALQGNVAGVQVSSNSGAPGAGANIVIRGGSTLSDGAVTPLFVVDGVIMESIDMINPNDIKSIDVLKDGASAAIYGSRSANGVILVTTKGGEQGKTKVDVRYLRSYSTIANTVPQVNKFERVLNESSTRGAFLGEKFSANPDSVGFVQSTSNNYQEILTQTAARNDLGLTISGGTDKVRYFNSLNYINEEGIIITSYNKKANLRTNIDFTASPKLTFGSRLSLGYRKTNNISEGDALGWALKRITFYPIYYPDGSLAPVWAMGGQRNPVQEILGRKRESNIFDGTFNQYLEFKFTNWLTFRASGSVNVELRRYNEFNSKELDAGNNEDTRRSSGRDQTTWRWGPQADAYLTAKRNFNDHSLTAMIGTSMQSEKRENLRFAGNYYVSESGPSTMNLLTLSTNDTDTRFEEWAIASFFGRVNYAFGSKYLISAILRQDGSSRFGPKNRWGTFPSASIGWRFSEENFMAWANHILSEGKFRASYGTNGNDQPLGPYDYVNRFSPGAQHNGLNGVANVSVAGNPRVQWEQTIQTNYGVDLGFLDGRVNIMADYYIKSNQDLISTVNLPTTTGFNNMKMNLASVENRGVEISVMAFPLPRTKDFSWQTTINWAKNKNTVTDLAREDYLHNNIWYVAKGQPSGNFYGYKQLGIYQYDASNAYTEDYSTRLIPVVNRDQDGNVIIGLNGQPTVEYYTLPSGEVYNGDVKKLEVNGIVARGGDVIWQNLPNAEGTYDNKIDDSDRMLLGNAQPKWDLGLINSFTYKRWSFSFNFYARWGGKIYNAFKRGYSSWGGNLHNQYPEYVRTGWKWPGQITDWYWISNDRNYNYRELSSFFLEDGSFIRLRNVRLGYSLDRALSRKAYMNNVEIYVYGTNLLTWTNYTGFDPEIGGGVLAPGRDGATYPRKREVGFGVNISF